MARTRERIAIVALAPWGLWIVCRLLGLDRFHPVIAMMSFTPYMAALSPAPLLLALGLRAWRVAAVAAIVSLLFAVALAGRALPDDQPDARGRVITLIAANVLRGNKDAHGVVRLVRDHDADVLGLTELEPSFVEMLRSAGIGGELPYFADDSMPGFAGSGLMSRSRIVRTETQTIGSETDATEGVTAGGELLVRVVHPLPPVSVGAAARWRRMLAAIPCARCGPGPPRIVLGDFNATLDHSALRGTIGRGYSDAADALGEGFRWTWPEVGHTKLTIDHALIDRRLRVLSYDVVPIPGSDHRAVVARVRLP